MSPRFFVYEASEHALPFLLELSRCEELPQRAEVIGLLASFAFSTNPNNPDYAPLEGYELRIRVSLLESVPLFEQLAQNSNVDLATAAREAMNLLNTDLVN